MVLLHSSFSRDKLASPGHFLSPGDGRSKKGTSSTVGAHFKPLHVSLLLTSH